MIGHVAAQIARDAATLGFNSTDFMSFSGAMCWDAVVMCMKKAGAADPGSITSASFSHVVSTSDPAVNHRTDMQHVPQGAFIGFFNPEGRLIHAMIATGFGCAAGNKNACIGVGSPVGWEVLDLGGKLHWVSGGVRIDGQRYTIHYRALD
ncbi:hypothetical protein [Chondromyces crocatus]|uniref:NlpC/P60 domain-containing protein n=1 Tax=Chondromyces crocatus TaxID=52 RepID=A0A0K1EJX0_CHOCO|nr:hypothetical protein [Chondromyces crocatus]AKT41155.1 uncharacterized protein CMC5_053160 [Chondromyces crocatus]